ncbi:hypothetical protein DKT74_19790 [Streptomyces sp. ZEA17I]|uniref:Uncharacterized protein n=1 Tax=Streptomyces rhizosphaericola TaxID=2564098 RepID=A0ABY2PH34_9ACTN|nr:hypothetical protein DKT74_19790 [Streptomyces sp. ZEA17I]TGZ10201.1 hypothetical protein E5Z02_11125 [Streptomyces rhizosphaericola]
MAAAVRAALTRAGPLLLPGPLAGRFPGSPAGRFPGPPAGAAPRASTGMRRMLTALHDRSVRRM